MAAGKAASKPSLWQNERLRFIVCFCGVFVCYFYYGILQETITRGDYSHAGKTEKFRYATTLVFIQCVINAAFARLLILVFESSKQDHTRSWLYGMCSLSYLGAMVSSNSALQYVNYPTQSYLPTSLRQTLLNEKLTYANHLLRKLSLALSFCIAVLWTGEVWEFLSFADRYPGIIYNILLFGITSALGQTFIFMTVVYFGPLTCSIITTTRKFFTILGSVLLFGNIISPMQWFGTILIFLGLGLDAKFGKSPKKTTY
ncbi:solute carrier family 35 member B1-like [Sinocyclocheilus rhinocerous]|uniref:solute carrier family 35 member B1-like n=1 Tax=Sinocyclocheilus rhinocerous TaxID=307959 RepID=UPI0007B9C972|nr:PREDICTED: solute carrier family 35 member B1-like [Sinocyclocheilus rhinocerous]